MPDFGFFDHPVVHMQVIDANRQIAHIELHDAAFGGGAAQKITLSVVQTNVENKFLQ